MKSDVYDHLDLDGKPFDRSDYSLVSTGIDWGQHWNHVVTMGVHKDNHRVDLIGLRRVRTVTDVEHLNQDINEVMEEIRKYNPDIILPDNGYSGNNNLILLKEFGAKKVFSVIVKSATSSGDIVAHFSEPNHTVTIDKVMQNMLMLSNMRRGDIHFWRPVDADEKLFVEHWSNAIIRTEEQEVKGTTQLKYTKHYIRKGDD